MSDDSLIIFIGIVVEYSSEVLISMDCDCQIHWVDRSRPRHPWFSVVSVIVKLKNQPSVDLVETRET